MKKEIRTKIIKNKNLAITLSYMTKQDFLTYDNNYDKTKKVYSFINTDRLQEALTVVMNFRNKIKE